MQFTAECWIKTYRLESDWLGAFGWEVRAVFSALAVKFDAAGNIPLGPDPWRCLAGLTGIPTDVLRSSVETLIAANALEFVDTDEGSVLHDPKFLTRQGDAGRRAGKTAADASRDGASNPSKLKKTKPAAGAMTDAERARAYRQRRRSLGGHTPDSDVHMPTDENVTNVTSRVTKTVTERHVTDRHDFVTGATSEVLEKQPLHADRHGRHEQKKERKKERIPPTPPTRGALVGPSARAQTQPELDSPEPPPSLANEPGADSDQQTHRDPPRPGEQTPPSGSPAPPEPPDAAGEPVGEVAPRSPCPAAPHGGPMASLSGAETTHGAIEIYPPLPDGTAAPQSACSKSFKRDVGTRRLESAAFVEAYELGILHAKKCKGEEERYSCPRRALSTLDDALDTYGPRPMQGDRQDWLRRAANMFGQYGVGEEPGQLRSYDPGAFLAWLNAGNLPKAIEHSRRERAERRAEKARTYVYRPMPESERLENQISIERTLLENRDEVAKHLGIAVDVEEKTRLIAELEAQLAEVLARDGASPEQREARHG